LNRWDMCARSAWACGSRADRGMNRTKTAASLILWSTCCSRGRPRDRPKTLRRPWIRSAASWTLSPPRNTPATTSRCWISITGAYAAENVIISAAGNIEHAAVRAALEKAFGSMPSSGTRQSMVAPNVVPKVVIRSKDLEQSHLCLGASSYPQNHDARYASYVLNTILGCSMSSRLFQNIRETRGLAYSVFSGINAYRDAGSLTVS